MNAEDVQEFDYIVVGAGSAGAVLAERLSADGTHAVLLIEEGGDDSWLSRMPKGYGKLMADPQHAHFYPIVHDASSLGPAETWARGKMLGGSSAINGMVWIRGGAVDYDHLEALGNPGWGWSTMLPYFRKLEDHQLGASDDRGAGGPICIKTNPEPSRLADAFIKAGTEMGLSVKNDQNGPTLEGVGYAQWNIDPQGRRVSSARAFLRKAASRPNLKIETLIRIDRVLLENKRVTGVAGVRNGQPVTFRCRGEVILSTGGIVSPKILQQSGIGDAAILKAAGIGVVHHSPNVGRRMREHLTLPLNFRLREWKDSQNRAYSGVRLLANVLRYLTAGKGPLALGAAEAIAFVRADPDSKRADTQLMFNPYSLVPGDAIVFEDVPGMQCYSYHLRPDSEGTVLVATSDPAAPPIVNANYLATEHDQRVSIAGTHAVRRIMSQPALAPFVVKETALTSGAQSDDEILDLYRRCGHSGYHAVGTAAMGPKDEDVVDAKLRVRGVTGLRVMDCSIFPEIPSGNTNAPVLAAAWHASDLILADGLTR